MNARKLALAGAVSVAAIVGTMTLPFSMAGATSGETHKTPEGIVRLKSENNEALGLSTELDCTTHTLTAKVTNKTDMTVTPDVTFNGDEPTVPDMPVEPGMTADYYYNYDSNALRVDTTAAIDGEQEVTVTPTLYCSEPVSLDVTETSSSAIVGKLRNNNSVLPQVAYTQVGSGDVRMEVLMPGETRTVAMPFKSVEGQVNAMVKIGTAAGFESSYVVDLNQLPEPQPIPLPEPKNKH